MGYLSQQSITIDAILTAKGREALAKSDGSWDLALLCRDCTWTIPANVFQPLDTVTLRQGASIQITPQTLNYLGAVSTFEPSGYVVTVGDARLLATFTGLGIDVTALGNAGINTSVGGSISKTQVGTSFTLVGTTINTLFGSNSQLSTSLTVTGRDSGARITIPLIVKYNS